MHASFVFKCALFFPSSGSGIQTHDQLIVGQSRWPWPLILRLHLLRSTFDHGRLVQTDQPNFGLIFHTDISHSKTFSEAIIHVWSNLLIIIIMVEPSHRDSNNFTLNFKFSARKFSKGSTTAKAHNTLTKKCGNSNTCVTRAGSFRAKCAAVTTFR